MIMDNIQYLLFLIIDENLIFIIGHEDDHPGFPMSSLLRQHEVGLGRAARNFASQSINRVITQVRKLTYHFQLL